jgi:type IV pilus assembly protein PilF
MKYVALVLFAAGLIAGCTTSGDPQRKAEPERASQLNLDAAIYYMRRGELKVAKEKLDRALEQNPRNAMAQATAGLLYNRLGDNAKAASHFERAVSLDPENPDILNNYATVLCQQDKFERGEKYALQTATNGLYKTPERGYLNAGNCARSAGDLKRAEQHYRSALKVRPGFGAALYEMTNLEFRQNNYMSARAFLERYLQVSRADPTTLWLGVQIERGLGNTAAASEYARRLKSEYPTAAETKALLETERNSG